MAIKIKDWNKSGNLWLKTITITNSDLSNDDIINIINCDNIQYREITESIYPRNRRKGESQSEYIADITGIKGNREGDSFYSKPINMNIPDIGNVNGVLRLSNHRVDIGTFAENNPQYDFGISIVVGEVERKYPDKDILNKRNIIIYEYVLDKNFENKERVLRNIADKIVDIKNSGWNKDTNVGIKVKPDIISNMELEETIRRIVKKILREENLLKDRID